MTRIANGAVHDTPKELKHIFIASEKLLDIWNSLTPLARNEWICWVVSVKKEETKQKHIERLQADLMKGKRRPCCWAGCMHR